MQRLAGHLTPPLSDEDHTLGPENAPVELVEFGDYECPYCGAAQPAVREIRQQMGDRLRYGFRNFPLTQVHPFAEQAAEAAEAAGGQGKFWQMHDLLFQNQQALQLADLLGYAQQLGLDMNRFQRDLQEHTYLPRIRRDYESGVASGVPGTPTFFINGQMYQGPVDANSLLRAMSQPR